MKYFACLIEYDGFYYHGWQKQNQNNIKSIQKILEDCLSKIACDQINICCAGRTDAGVHATAQVINFKTKSQRNTYNWIYGTNTILPSYIKIINCIEVDNSFHARFSAIYRRYNYVILNNNVYNPLFYNRVYWEPKKLNVELMNEEASYLLGEHNFKYFSSPKAQTKTYNRKVHHAYFKKYKNIIIFDIQANAFLYNMVRNIIGLLIFIGKNSNKYISIKHFIDTNHVINFPKIKSSSYGLYLVEVGYEKKYQHLCYKKLLNEYFIEKK